MIDPNAVHDTLFTGETFLEYKLLPAETMIQWHARHASGHAFY